MKQKFRTFPGNQDNRIVSTAPVAFIVFMVAFSFLGCGGIITRLEGPLSEEDLSKINDLTRQVESRNNDLKTFKGIGRIEWLYDDTVQHARLAWVGEGPDRIRLEILDIAGRPALSLSSDGEHLYFFSHPDNRFEKTGSDNVDLEPFISIAVPLRDIIQLLAGRLPFSLNQDDITIAAGTDNRLTLLIRSNWVGKRRRIDLNPMDLTIHAFEIFQPLGTLLYRAEFKGYLHINEFLIPENITLFAENGTFFKLRVDRYWANVPVPREAFMLAPPE